MITGYETCGRPPCGEHPGELYIALTYADLHAAAAGAGQRLCATQLGVSPAFDIALCGGNSAAQIAANLEARTGWAVPAQYLTPTMLSADDLLVAPVLSPELDVPVAVVGIGCLVELALRTGRHLLRPLPWAGAPAVRLLAAPDEAAAYAQVTRGMLPARIFDARHR